MFLLLNNLTSSSIIDVVQDEEHVENVKHQVNDHMEEDDDNKTIEDDGTNTLIKDTIA